MSSLVPSGIKKGKKTQSSKADVTVQETVPEHDEETLEILQGDVFQQNLFLEYGVHVVV